MRLALSNIAWDRHEDEAIANLLHQFDIDAIDVAPGKYFSDPLSATDTEIANIKNWWRERRIEITGMQALLFGTNGLNVFAGAVSQAKMLEHLQAVCRIASGLGAKRLVFGSPKNRDRTGLSALSAIEIASSFFQRLGDLAQNEDVLICLEPNPPCYGANFMIDSLETAHMVRVVDHPAIKMQFDTGAITINEEDPLMILKDACPLIGHIHASEPELVPLGDTKTDHVKIARALDQWLPHHIVSIEMLATRNESHEISIHRALTVANQHYRAVA